MPNIITPDQPDSQKKAKAVEIQRIYAKDISLEMPGAPNLFKEEWQPEISVELRVKNNALADDFYEVVLHITLTAKKKEQTAFLVEIHQTGIFRVSGFDEKERTTILNIGCPTILFPYARSLIADLMTQASLPAIHLAPVNFEALYRQQFQGSSGEVAQEPGKETVIKH